MNDILNTLKYSCCAFFFSYLIIKLLDIQKCIACTDLLFSALFLVFISVKKLSKVSFIVHVTQCSNFYELYAVFE